MLSLSSLIVFALHFPEIKCQTCVKCCCICCFLFFNLSMDAFTAHATPPNYQMHEFLFHRGFSSFQETQTLHVEGLCLDIDNMVLDFKTSINVVFLFFLSYFIVVYLILFHYLDFCLPGFF